MEASKQLKEQMREAFDKDDRYCRVRFSQMDQDSKQRPRYCATGDEKYYLDLPGKENEKVVKFCWMKYDFYLSSQTHPPFRTKAGCQMS